MTDAERKLLELAVAGDTHDYRGNETAAWTEARQAVLVERCTPEMKAQYRALFNAYRDAHVAFSSWRSEVVPNEISQAWYAEFEKERGQ
jgi:hypothetical protein